MRIKKKFTMVLTCLLILSVTSIFKTQISQVGAQGSASLTGNIYDSGVDTDGDGTFNYLRVGVEVDVTASGTFRVEVSGLYDSWHSYISVWDSEYTYLDVGVQIVYLSLDGPTIYISGLNPAYVSNVYLYDEYYSELDYLYDVPLSREYSYTEFDLPPASLTDNIYDVGVDTDADGRFDYLEVGVEVNVTTSGMFHVRVSSLRDSEYNYIDVWDSKYTHLNVGIQVVYLSLDGPKIYVSGFNPAYVSSINLYDEHYNQLDYLYDVPLSREYSYTEFDLPPAFLTGNIYDRGVDTDGDGRFDYLEVGVQVNVTASGAFQVEVSGLRDSWHSYISVWDSEYTYLHIGVQIVYLSLDGPRIYISGLNPIYVSGIYLYDEHYEYPDYLYDVPLSREYSYTEFDLPPALLTGNIYDSGVDTDGDGTFNYLKVGVKVNVTEPGDYEVYVSGLWDINGSHYISVSDSETAHLDVGVRVIYVSLYGPTIYVSGVNPANISYISLYQPNDYDYYLGSLHDVPLSREYRYTEFDSPFADAGVRFIVYPDGRVVMAGALKYTDIVPQYTGPVTQGVMAFGKTDDLMWASVNCTFTIPPEVLSDIPFDSIDFTLSSTGSDDVFDTEIFCSVVLSDITASQFPFNVTDFTATGQYENNLLTGTITIHMLPGFALGDLDIDFEGNRTDLFLSGTITVIYGTYYDWELNEASLNEMIQQINSTINSLYNITYGSLECTMLNITVTPHNAIGATIDFEVTIHGDFIQALTYVILPPYYYYPPETVELVYSALNATYSSIESASFELAYAHVQKEASMRLRIVTDFDKLVEKLIPSLQETAPPEITQLIESLLETRYCSVKSVDLSFSYDDDEGDLKVFVAVEGDLNAELNYIKSMLLTYGLPLIDDEPLSPWQASFINETEIDVSNFTVSFNLAETSYGGYSGGFATLPPRDVINATSFKLERFFNLTADASFPGERERLKVTIVGGSNATHTVTLFRPETVPEPDVAISDNRIMVWNNQTLSSLKDLIFNIRLETGVAVFDIANPELVTTTNPFIIDARETASTLISITQISKPVTVIIRNVTAPPEGVGPAPGTFKVLGNYVEIIASETDIIVNATIRIYYTPEQLEAAGLDEDTLKIHYWNATLGEWVAVESHVNTTEHYVWAIIDHFTLWALMGQPPSPPPPIWAQPWFWVVIGCVIAIAVAITVIYIRKKKHLYPSKSEITQ